MDFIFAAPRQMRSPPLLLPLVTLLFITKAACGGGELLMLGPWLVEEPAARVQFAAAAGARLRCAARGSPPPTITWLDADGAPLQDVPALRRMYSNGTLEILPASGLFEAAPSTVRCRAANAHGVALSRDISLQPVSDEGWEAVAVASAAALGGVAAVTCSASNTQHAALVRPALWYRADAVLHLDPPSPQSRYLVAGNTLLIRDVTAEEAGAYSCLARHALSATTKRARPALLTLTPTPTNSAPRLVSAGGELSVPVGSDVCLPCVASDLQQPHYTWYREVGGRLVPVEPEAAGGWSWAGGAAHCLPRVSIAAAGLWICKAYNAYGDATAHLTLSVQDVLSVTVAPSVLVADAGSPARFSCAASDTRAALTWLHDGAPAGAGADLVLRAVTRAHRGVYQCVARRAADSAQAAAELRLGESAPELHYTFIEQALRAGGGVSLRCAASAAPPPLFTWLLDDMPLDQYRAHHRYSISSETSVTGDVISVLNISSVSVTDGGRYTCRAHNQRGQAEHSARLNIYGPPSIRALGPVRVVAGANATIYCPYAGYPIRSIELYLVVAARRGDGAGRRGAGERARRRAAPGAGAGAGRGALRVRSGRAARARRAQGHRHTSAQST